ncbi:hypothetical protein [Zavarzinella formosa]|uniref:hypothetical protein n=1 Tax=Zavarzinella formosa TaxID=360055 RepID=UPI0002E4318D|nr:hypothetical protein [Zavarzinella formosa]
MKRTAAAFMLLAGLGGCMTTDKRPVPNEFGKATKPQELPTLVGPHGEPVAPVAYRGSGSEMGNIMRADYREGSKGGVMQASAGGPQDMGFVGKKAQEGWVATGSDGVPAYYPGRGILPVPAMGPFGAVAAVGALPGGAMAPINARTSVRFSDPANMSISWYGAGGLNDNALVTPARYNFPQGGIYRLKLSNVKGNPGTDFYPTLEVLPASPKTATYLAHSSVPLSFTEEDFAEVVAGNFLVKVIYLPDPQYQDIAAVAGPAEVISTRLEPGVNPIEEARRRGEILLIVRLGNIDLEAKGTPALDAPNPFAGGMGGPMMRPGPGPGGLPPGLMPGGGPTIMPTIPAPKPGTPDKLPN